MDSLNISALEMFFAQMVKLANTQDSGSCVRIGLAGSIPAPGTVSIVN